MLLFLGKRSWWGCGKHVPSIMDSVPDGQRCVCQPRISRNKQEYPPMAKQADWLVRNAAAAVLWTRGMRVRWSAEGVVEEPLEEPKK